MSAESTVRAAFDAFNRHDVAASVAPYANNSVVHDPQHPAPLEGIPALRKDTEDFFRAFPDIRAELRHFVVSGNIVAFDAAVTGTHKGPMAGPTGEIPATGKRVEMSFAAFARVENDKIVEEHRYYDLAGLMAQLGLLEG